MAEIYRLERAGGPKSPGWLAYLARVEHRPALAAHNPMAGPGELGWEPLGLPWQAGYRWAIARAHGTV
jgi:hypothetical protein